jgi:hypothetical protein
MTTIQPGTRCGCRDGLHSHPLSHHKAPFICTRDAVRMVTVNEPCDYCAVPLPGGKRGWETGDCDGCDKGITQVQYAMCAPCAAYHEAKAGAR